MVERGTYAFLSDMKTDLGINDTVDDSNLLDKLELASRAIDQHVGRHFYAVTATRYFTASKSDSLFLNWEDLLSVTTLKADEDGDRTYEITWAATDYDLYPHNYFPKFELRVTPEGDYTFPGTAKGVEIAGLWGYGDGTRATPYDISTSTVTVATTTGTTITASDGTQFKVGQTILAGTEQMYLTAISSNNLTAVRGVNGTTAATHSAATTYVYAYPGIVTRVCKTLAHRLYLEAKTPTTIIGATDVGQLNIGVFTRTELFMLAPLRKIAFS